MEIIGVLLCGYVWQLVCWIAEVKMFNVCGNEKISALNAFLITFIGFTVLLIGMILLMKIFNCRI